MDFLTLPRQCPVWLTLHRQMFSQSSNRHAPGEAFTTQLLLGTSMSSPLWSCLASPRLCPNLWFLLVLPAKLDRGLPKELHFNCIRSPFIIIWKDNLQRERRDRVLSPAGFTSQTSATDELTLSNAKSQKVCLLSQVVSRELDWRKSSQERHQCLLGHWPRVDTYSF